MKKLLMLAIITILVILPITTVSADSGKCGDNLTWALDDEGTLTISGTGDMWDYYVNDMPWVSFRSDIEKVIVGNSVTSIGSYAFYKFTNLVDLTIGTSVTKIGERAFSSCAFENIMIPDGITVISDYTFYDCADLISISIPNSVTSIGDYAFANCDNLTSITIPNNVTSIGKNAFYCLELTSLYVPVKLKDENINYGTDKVIYYHADICDNGIEYSFDIAKNCILKGTLYVAAYDSSNSLLAIKAHSVDDSEADTLISDEFEFDGTAAYLRAFLWNDNLKPVSATDRITPQ